MTTLYQGSLEKFGRDLERIPYILAGEADPARASAALLGRSEFRAWTNSLRAVELMLLRAGLAPDCGILIEYRLPATSRRIDVLLSGHDAAGKPGYVVIELKQWSSVEVDSSLPNTVRTNVGNASVRTVAHPCYQARSYQEFLDRMNTAVSRNGMRSGACAFLHNYVSLGTDDPLAQPPNDDLVKTVPLFGRFDGAALGGFLRERVGRGDGLRLLDDIVSARIAPSKSLINEISGLFNTVRPTCFVLLDEQRIAYETILREARRAKAAEADGRRVIIVEGGPGTGKSVVAMSVFVKLLRENVRSEAGRNIRFVSPTASFREAMVRMLAGGVRNRDLLVRTLKDVRLLFCGSMGFFEENEKLRAAGGPACHYSVLVVDEAHRLHSRQNMYRGRNQVEDVVEAARTSVFFVDDNQALRPDDIGSVASIRAAAGRFGADVSHVRLAAQFRCSGAEGFLNWIGDVFGLTDGASANAEGWDFGTYDFDIVDDPMDIVRYVDEINRPLLETEESRTKGGVLLGARMVAGYAWDWTKTGNMNGEAKDVRIGDLALAWNSRAAGSAWAIDPKTRHEVGCVHTTQGLEFEYVGVFIGPDLVYDEKRQCLRADYDHYRDKGGKSNLQGRTKAEREKDLLKYVCRCYRVLLSRGMKGARVYCCDAALGRHLRQALGKARRII